MDLKCITDLVTVLSFMWMVSIGKNGF